MNFTIVFGVEVLVSFEIRVWWLTMSNALLMSSAIVIVLRGGFLLLKPVVIWFVSWWSAVAVECLALKPC